MKQQGKRTEKDSQTFLSDLSAGYTNRDNIFKAPPFESELAEALSLIGNVTLSATEENRRIWEREQNATCWAEYDCLQKNLKGLAPTKVFEFGPGLGRSIVFLNKMFNWKDSTFYLYDGYSDIEPNEVEDSIRYARYGSHDARYIDSFYGNLKLLEKILQFNEIKNYKIIDANKNSEISNLQGGYDFVYSFYSVGFHWAIDHFIDDILHLLKDGGTGAFNMQFDYSVTPFLKEKLKNHSFEIVRYLTACPKDCELNMLLIRK